MADGAKRLLLRREWHLAHEHVALVQAHRSSGLFLRQVPNDFLSKELAHTKAHRRTMSASLVFEMNKVFIYRSRQRPERAQEASLDKSTDRSTKQSTNCQYFPQQSLVPDPCIVPPEEIPHST